MFRELRYQTKVFNALDYYLDVLNQEKAEAQDRIDEAEKNPDKIKHIPDYPEFAFGKLKKEKRLPVLPERAALFSPRYDRIFKDDPRGRPVPNVTFKVPTGGGKTWLAVKSASMILNKYLGKDTGFILWIVPSEAIYTQTVRNFKDREHPYRLALDRAAANRVKILEKDDRLDAADVESHLCVMVLMLQSANRQTKESLRMFRDRGDVYGFTPPEGEQQKHRELLERIPNLDHYESDLLTSDGNEAFPIIKDSLGNALRMIRPMVVIDEGHKAISALADDTLYGFNPSFVLELTATPKDQLEKRGKNARKARYANLLVEITGLELDAEGMIKMPLVLDRRQGTDWKATLDAAVDRLNALRDEAKTHQQEGGNYIRPILLVQVERTGKEQRDSGHIHADDARDRLLEIGFREEEIAIKTAEQNDLKQSENQDLFSETNQVRVIITKEALKEGWDCSFAYILCSLAARSNLDSMTQLVGRILRQPHAEKTGMKALDQCYVFAHQVETRVLVDKIRNGLKGEGLGDLVVEYGGDGGKAATGMLGSHIVHRRKKFKSLNIYLPWILINCGDALRRLDYGTDILTKIDWREYDPRPIATHFNIKEKPQEHQLYEFEFSKSREQFVETRQTEAPPEYSVFDPVLAVRKINDIVLNPFVAREIIGRLIAALEQKGFDELLLGFMSTRIVEELRRGLLAWQDEKAEGYFRAAVTDGHIQFRLRADGNNWPMPYDIFSNETNRALQLVNNNGELTQKSLFDPVFQTEMNKDERDVAVYLDGQKALGWWHRNVARRHYALQGWKKDMIYPDFIFSVEEDGKPSRIVVLETKGPHLEGNQDTQYKEAVMKFLTEQFALDDALPVGEMIVEGLAEKVVCEMVLIDECQKRLQEYFGGG